MPAAVKSAGCCTAPGRAAPGEGRYFWRIMGATHECIEVGDAENSLQHVWNILGVILGTVIILGLVAGDFL